MIQQRTQAEPMQPPVLELDAADVLKLRKHSVGSQKGLEPLEDAATLLLRHERQAKRREHYVDMVNASLAKFGFDTLDIFIYEN